MTVGSCQCGSESCRWCGIFPPPDPIVARFRCVPIIQTDEAIERLMGAHMREAREAARMKRRAPRGTWNDS